MRNIIATFVFVIFCSVLPSRAQQNGAIFSSPFDFELMLSGNFGELRSNHFHSGIDFKTQGVVGKPIRCVADGYISRATVQAGGYGLALYVMHDNGYMTVYGHLDRFPASVHKRVREYQYGNETFAVDISFAPDELRVSRGEVLAYAGNTGYSFGPHLHFEVRDSTGEELYDPMLFFGDRLKDTRKPVATEVAVYPLDGYGVADGSSASKVLALRNGTLADTLSVWGRVGFGIKALDYMDGTSNKYGVYRVELLVDDSLRFDSRMEQFSFGETRLINAWADYARYVDRGEWFLRSFILGNNTLRALEADACSGIINFNEERLYEVEYRLSDYHGNTNVYRFNVRGTRQDIPPYASEGHYLLWFLNNALLYDGVRLDIPAGELFESRLIEVGIADGEYGVSRRYTFGSEPIPLWHGAELSIRVDSMAVDSSKLYIKRITRKGGHSVGGKYADGRISTDVNALGTFEVAVDTVPPRVSPVKEGAWARNGKVVLAVSDKESAFKSFRGTLDGRFVLFKYSSKNGRLELDLKAEGVSRGVHQLRVELVDACGNVRVYEKKIRY